LVAAASAVLGIQLDGAIAASIGESRRPRQVKAIAFDGFPIIDPRPVQSRCVEVFGSHGEALANAWRARQFDYTWLRTLSGQYRDFWHVTEDALVYAANSLGMPVSGGERRALMHSYLELQAWPDVRASLEVLRSAGVRMAFLSNLTASMLDSVLQNSGLREFFEPHMSTDSVGAYKPDPRAYGMALTAFGLSRQHIMFCASASWDAAGAKWFGLPTFWLNRSKQPAEELGVQPDAMASTLPELVDYVLKS
jgi:2-haloacid dehalogenase